MKTALIAALVALVTATSAHAGGRNYGYGHYGHGYGHYGRHGGGYGHHYGRHHYRHRHHGHYGYLAAGLLLGGAFVHSMNRPYVVRERVVYRRPVERVGYREPIQQTRVRVERGYEPVPAEPPPYYYRRDADGECWLIERAEDGSETITPQDPNVCG